MANKIQLSYLIATKNKLPYLKRAMERLLSQRKEDEEILVADGGSNDDTREYLDTLKRESKINFFVSEPDHGISHALNKLSFAARGELLTIITDDDVFCYQTISACKMFMIKHQDIDLMGSNGGSFHNHSKIFKDEKPTDYIKALEYEKSYQSWQKTKRPFSFCDLGSILRRSSLPLLGLHDTSFHAPDAEFTLRATASKANIAWHTGYSYVNISNPQSASLINMKKINEDLSRLNKFYLDRKPDSFITQKLKALRVKLSNGTFFSKKQTKLDKPFIMIFPKLVEVAEQWLEQKNKQKKIFLWKN